MQAGDVIRNRYLAGVTASHALRAAGLLTSLWLTPFVLGTLGREQYGIYVLALSVAGWLRVCDLGSAAALQTRLARLPGDAAATSTLVTAAFTAQIFTALLAFISGLALAAGFPAFAGLAPSVAGGTVAVVVLLSLDASVSLLARVFSAVLIARQRFPRDNAVQLAAMGLRVAVTVVLLLEGWGLVALAVALLSGSLLRLALTYFESRRIEKFVIRRTLLAWRHLRDVGGLGIWFSVGGLAGLMILSVDSILAAKLVSVESVAVLYLTARLYDLAEGMFKPVVDVARPVLGALLGQSETSKAADVYRKLESLTMVFALVLSASIWAVNEQFITAWVGPDNYGGLWLNSALAAAFVVNLWVLPKRAVLSAALVVKPQSLSRLGEGVVKIALSIVLGRRFGLPGIVSATSLASLSNSVWYLERLVAATFKSQDAAAPFTLRMRPLVFIPVLMAAIMGWRLSGAVSGYTGVALGFIATAIAAACVIWTLGADHGTRARLSSLVPVLAKRAAGVESRA